MSSRFGSLYLFSDYFIAKARLLLCSARVPNPQAVTYMELGHASSRLASAHMRASPPLAWPSSLPLPPCCQAAKIGDHCYSVYGIALLKKNPKGSFPCFCVPFLLILYRATCCLHQGCGRWTITARHSSLVIYHISETAWQTHCYALSSKFWSSWPQAIIYADVSHSVKTQHGWRKVGQWRDLLLLPQ